MIRTLLKQLKPTYCTVKFKPAKIEKFVKCDYCTWDNSKNDYVQKTGIFFYCNGNFYNTNLAEIDNTDWIVSFVDCGKIYR